MLEKLADKFERKVKRFISTFVMKCVIMRRRLDACGTQGNRRPVALLAASF